MRVSARTDYALRAVIQLAAAGRPLTIREICADLGVSYGAVTDALKELRRSRLVVAAGNGHDGFRLARDPAEITVGDIVAVVDPELLTPIRHNPVPPGRDITLDSVWQQACGQVRVVLDRVSLADLSAGTASALLAAP